MAVIKTIFKGESLSMLFIFPVSYDMARIEKHEVYIGETAFTGTVSGKTIALKLKSDDTGAMSGQYKVSLWLDDTILGLWKPHIGDIVSSSTNATTNNDSTSEVFSIIIPVVVSETAVTVGDILYNILKGDKGDPFLYADFTPEQIATLQQPASDAIASVQAVELSVEQAEALRVQAEIDRQTNTGTAIQNAETATGQAKDAAILANTKAGLANDAATNANTKAGLADTAATNANTKAGLADTAATNADNARLAIQGDLALKENTANKQNSLAVDGTGVKLVTVDAVNAGLDDKPTIYYSVYDFRANVETTIPSTAFTPQLIEAPINIEVFKDGILHSVTSKYVKNGNFYDIKITSTEDLVGANITVLGNTINQYHYFVNEDIPRTVTRNTIFAGAIKYVSPTGNDTTGNGTIGNPYKTITKAYATSLNGGIIQLTDGIYQTSDEAGGYVLFNTSSKGVLISGNQNDKSAVVINLSVASSFMLRMRDCGEMRIENLTILTNQNTACISKEGFGNLNLKIYNCDITNTSLSSSAYCIQINTNYSANQSHIEIDNCNINRSGNTNPFLIISSSINHTVLISNNTITSTASGITYPNGNKGTIAIYDNNITINSNYAGLSFGTDVDAPSQNIAFVDVRNNNIEYGAGNYGHAILLGRGVLNAFCVNNTLNMDATANSLAIGIAIKSTAVNAGDCIIAGNIITAPRPLYIKGGQNNIIAWNTAICNSLTNNGAFEVDNPVNPDGEKISTGNVVLNNNLFGKSTSIILYNTTSSENVNITIQSWTVDYNLYYKQNFTWCLDVATDIDWASKSDLWNIAVLNDMNSKLTSRKDYILSDELKNVIP